MQKTLSTLLWIKGREKANEYSGSHTPTKGLKHEPRLLVLRNSMDMEWVFCLWDDG